jgi:hypothetical protein
VPPRSSTRRKNSSESVRRNANVVVDARSRIGESTQGENIKEADATQFERGQTLKRLCLGSSSGVCGNSSGGMPGRRGHIYCHMTCSRPGRFSKEHCSPARAGHQGRLRSLPLIAFEGARFDRAQHSFVAPSEPEHTSHRQASKALHPARRPAPKARHPPAMNLLPGCRTSPRANAMSAARRGTEGDA